MQQGPNPFNHTGIWLVAGLLALVVIGIIIYGETRPSPYRTSRTTYTNTDSSGLVPTPPALANQNSNSRSDFEDSTASLLNSNTSVNSNSSDRSNSRLSSNSSSEPDQAGGSDSSSRPSDLSKLFNDLYGDERKESDTVEITCPICNGTKVETCPACHGSGRNTFPHITSYECTFPGCNGKGRWACLHCNGTGKVRRLRTSYNSDKLDSATCTKLRKNYDVCMDTARTATTQTFEISATCQQYKQMLANCY